MKENSEIRQHRQRNERELRNKAKEERGPTYGIQIGDRRKRAKKQKNKGRQRAELYIEEKKGRCKKEG